MDIDRIRALVDLVVASEIAELEIEQEGLHVKIRRYGTSIPAGAGGRSDDPPPATAQDAGTAGRAAAPAMPEPAAGRAVTSPIVGTFYRAPEQGTPNFVEVGQRVAPGDTLCIVEAMKVMNEIEAEFAGIVREICLESGQPVEAEGVLFRIEPL